MVIHLARIARPFSRILMHRKLVRGGFFSWVFSGQARSHCSATRRARTQTSRAASGRFTAVRRDRSEWTRVCVRLRSSRESSTGTEARSVFIFFMACITHWFTPCKHCHLWPGDHHRRRARTGVRFVRDASPTHFLLQGNEAVRVRPRPY